ncbi:MAG: hypothetical protein EOP52_07945 [Sphingobacteriales bacterium]|nr:MAG: hypothetical protein EOP52_07945 [Sphingobacteriales bacterium]
MKTRFLFAGLLAGLLGCTAPRMLVAEKPTGTFYPIDSTVGRSDRLTTLLRPYKAGVDTQMQVLVGALDAPLTKAQPESTMGNLVADAQLEAARKLDPKVVAAVSNYGGLRLPMIPKGAVTRGKIYELMPFDNTVCIVEIPGSVVQQYCNSMAKRKGWPVSGITFTIKDTAATNILIGGQKLDGARLYKFALNDYNARGGDNCDFLIPLKKRYTTVFIRDAIFAQLAAAQASGKPYHPYLDERVRYAD